MRRFFEEVARLISQGETVAVATIVRTQGSTPREVGAKMMVRAGGQIAGTVGGGCGEAEVWRAALNVIERRRPQTVTVDLTEEIDLRSDGVCGGMMDVFVEPWFREENLTSALVEAIVSGLRKRRPVALATVVEGQASLGHRMVVGDDGATQGSLGWTALEERVVADAEKALDVAKPHLARYTLGDEEAKAEVFIEPLLPAPTLLVVGAGHIAVPLAQMGRLLEFEVVVLDDRPSFANRERFPEADEVIAADYEAALRDFAITPDTYVVLVTRGHQHDFACLSQVIGSRAAYIGMIGSRRRVWAVFKLLHQRGVPLEHIARVHAPIGLDIGAETPAEIAVSIIAEVIKSRRRGKVASLSDQVRGQYLRLLATGAELSEGPLRPTPPSG